MVYIATSLMEEAVYNEILMLVRFWHAEGKRVSSEKQSALSQIPVFFLNIDFDILAIN